MLCNMFSIILGCVLVASADSRLQTARLTQEGMLNLPKESIQASLCEYNATIDIKADYLYAAEEQVAKKSKYISRPIIDDNTVVIYNVTSGKWKKAASLTITGATSLGIVNIAGQHSVLDISFKNNILYFHVYISAQNIWCLQPKVPVPVGQEFNMAACTS